MFVRTYIYTQLTLLSLIPTLQTQYIYNYISLSYIVNNLKKTWVYKVKYMNSFVHTYQKRFFSYEDQFLSKSKSTLKVIYNILRKTKNCFCFDSYMKQCNNSIAKLFYDDCSLTIYKTFHYFSLFYLYKQVGHCPN